MQSIERLLRVLRAIPLVLLSPFLIGLPILALAFGDLAWMLAGKRRRPRDTRPRTDAASVVIPNWNGRDLLEKYLPSVVEAMAGSPANEVIVVDNGSSDGSAEFVRERFPTVKVLALPKNLGFGGGSNAGFAAAANDIVVLLNSDMRVAPDFLRPLIDCFTDERVFAVSCQIFFSDPKKHREETGLTQVWWQAGGFRVRHRLDNAIEEPFPSAYPGGGSSAFDRRKFLELGGFDPLLHPFYLEDTDLGYLAWKRGWKVLYQPVSHVWHEHRGTIGKKFSREYINSIIKKNFLLIAWKNVHEWPRLAEHFLYGGLGALVSLVGADSLERASFSSLGRAFLQLPQAMAARWRARSLATVTDTEALRRPMGGYFRDRFLAPAEVPARPRVLFLSPYPICPPVHGGAVFMLQTLTHLTALTEVHLIALLDDAKQAPAHTDLMARCASSEFVVRLTGRKRKLGSVRPHAVDEFANADLDWLIHRQLLTKSIDVLQIEYLQLGQYHGDYRRIASILFEHDLYFQSVGRQLQQPLPTFQRTVYAFEYLRALRYELRLLPRLDRVQVCSAANASYLLSFRPELKPRLDDGLRAGIDVQQYRYVAEGREPMTLLFIGSFRHTPNAEALQWFLKHVFGQVRAARPGVKLIVIGSDPPPRHSLPKAHAEAIELRGFVDDVHEPLRRHAVFLCPILSGSGVRVKLLEAFASGIPCVSTYLGAEGIADRDGDLCALADEPGAFAQKIVRLLDNPSEAAAMAARARARVECDWDMAVRTRRLFASYRDELSRKRASSAR
jgi:GT2 family glycosyltransferase/glycosyltransferase involved in cell wall biosynthesis